MPYSIMLDAGHGEHRLRQFKRTVDISQQEQ